MDITSMEHAWREYVARCRADESWTVFAPTRDAWTAGYAAGASYALSAVKKLAAKALPIKHAPGCPVEPCECGMAQT